MIIPIESWEAWHTHLRQSIHVEPARRPQKWVSGGTGSFAFFERTSFKCTVKLLIKSLPASPAGTIEVTRNHADLLLYHDSPNCKDAVICLCVVVALQRNEHLPSSHKHVDEGKTHP